ncbi:MAG: hypothetical protein B7X00_01025, partial [Legionella sp. 21-45-4]
AHASHSLVNTFWGSSAYYDALDKLEQTILLMKYNAEYNDAKSQIQKCIINWQTHYLTRESDDSCQHLFFSSHDALIKKTVQNLMYSLTEHDGASLAPCRFN